MFQACLDGETVMESCHGVVHYVVCGRCESRNDHDVFYCVLFRMSYCVLLRYIAAWHKDLQNSRIAYEIQLHLTRVTTTTNKKKFLCCSTKHHDIETPLLRCHHKYTESVLSHHPPRARENRVGVMNTSHQAETADGIQFTFSLEPCEMSKQ